MPRRPPSLAFDLLQAADWFNDAIVARLEAQGWPALNRTQALTFPALGADGATPSELARRVGISRQSMQKLLEDLAGRGLVQAQPHPGDRRSLHVTLTDDGRRLVDDAITIARDLERLLARRIGRDTVDALRAALAVDWGPAPAP